MSGPPYPLHESVRDRLQPEYVEFYNRYLKNVPQGHHQPIAATRAASSVAASVTNPLSVGQKQDLLITRRTTVGPDIPVRVFTPDGHQSSPAGWPAMLYFHGGGFVFGNINTENTVCTHLCMRARCVVIAVDYRLAPEYPFPAPIDDSWEVFSWMLGEATHLLNIDKNRLAVGGLSAGANLAAVVAQRSLTKPLSEFCGFVQQLLVVPVADNTATVDNNPTWHDFQFTVGLTAEKMTWYRKHYLTDEKDWLNPEASPLLFPAEKMSRLPPALIVVAELDILRHEGEEYARKLKAAGVPVKLEMILGMPHSFLTMDSVLSASRSAITLLCETLASAFDFK